MPRTLNIIFASTSGHTEYVVDQLIPLFQNGLSVKKIFAEAATLDDLTSADVVLLASGTWNTGGIEGQLNPHMHVLLKEKAKDLSLTGKNCALIALGDERYFYTCRAVEHLQQFVREHGGTVVGNPLLIVNEPYGQEEKVRTWGQKFLQSIA